MPMGRKIFNYNIFLKNLKQNDIRSILDEGCDCQNSPYIYEPHQHIITGDLQIVSNIDLRKFMSYGNKFREPIYQSATDLSTSLFTAVDDFALTSCRKYKTRIENFEEWKEEVKRILKNRIDYLKERKPQLFERKTSIIEKYEVKQCLKDLKKKYIICAIDKAANNFVFVCKKYYLVTLMLELGVDLSTLDCVGNITYQPVNITDLEIINQHSQFMKDHFDVTINRDNECIPRIFWNPKLQETPCKTRFIAGARHCTTKQLSVLVNKALKILKNYFSKYCLAIYNNCGINCDWSINSSAQFLDKIQHLDTYNMQVYDFTTLYTNLNLGVVEELINEMIDLIFNNVNKYICISKYDDKCFFAKKQYNGYQCFSAENLKMAINFILQNTYIKFGNIILRQTRGIPMGGNSSSQLADLSLAKSEFNYMQSLLRAKRLNLAKLLSNNCRYVDDLITVNYLHFEQLIDNIYPSDLKMERSGNNNKLINYLDINISISESTIATDIYNKVDHFDFPVVMFTYPDSNLPIETGYNVFYSQILRYSNICSHLDFFILAVKKIYRIFTYRSYKHRFLVTKFRILMKNKPGILLKYSVSDIEDVEMVVFGR